MDDKFENDWKEMALDEATCRDSHEGQRRAGRGTTCRTRNGGIARPLTRPSLKVRCAAGIGSERYCATVRLSGWGI